MSIKVAIDSNPLVSGHKVRGIGVMVREEIKAIQKVNNGVTLNAVDFSKTDLSKYDIVHYPLFFPYQITLPPTKLAKKVIVTIQDLIHLIYPKKYPPGIKGKMNFLKQKKRLKYVDAIITISETSKKDICRLLDFPPEKVHVCYLAPHKYFKTIKNKDRLEKIKKKYHLPSKYVLYIGDINYNKNIPTLIEACKIAKTPLVLVGKQAKEIENTGLLSLMDISGPMDWIRFLFDIPHPEHAHYEKILNEFKNNNNIKRLGFVPDADIGEIMNMATVYCQPSYYEGFGLPVIEAMASETPVVISKTNCLVEVAEAAALIADPNDPKDLAEKITTVIKDKKVRKELIEKGFKRQKDFSWQKTAENMIDVYKSVYNS
jgi:glycosyltransferase involved in cell wall biosynthesis